MPPERPHHVPGFTPEDITLGEVYRLTVKTAEDVAYVRGRVETMGGLEERVASLEGFRAGMRRALLAVGVALIPVAAVALQLVG